MSQILDLSLPALADGWKKQKGDIFGFGIEESAETSKYSCLNSKNPERLGQAPVHSLSAEQSVGFVNYEFSERGNKQLEAAQVKTRFPDSLENTASGSFGTYTKLVRRGGRIPKILKDWSDKQQELLRKGSRDKGNCKCVSRQEKNADLDYLKVGGGSFTSPVQIDEYFTSSDFSDEERKKTAHKS